MSNEETVKEIVQDEEEKDEPVIDEDNEKGALLMSMDMADDSMLEMTSELERILDLQVYTCV